MRIGTTMMAGMIALSLTGCATKKYVTQTVQPVEQRVSQTETKNSEQDKLIASQGTQIDEIDKDLSRTKENLRDTDAKAVAAGQAAQQAGQRADQAQQSADGARSLAQQGMDKTTVLERNIEAMNKYDMVKSETVLFAFGQSKLTDDSKQKLTEFAKSADGLERYVIEIQGFTDKVGASAYNDTLSQQRAQAVARFLVDQNKVPVRSITMLGLGSAMPVGDEKTSEGRKQDRRVEVRLYVPEKGTGNTVASVQDQQ